MMRLGLILAVVVGCGGSGGGNPAGDDDDTTPDAPDPAGPGRPVSRPAKPTIFAIVLENHDYNEIVGSSNAPYMNSLIGSTGSRPTTRTRSIRRCATTST